MDLVSFARLQVEAMVVSDARERIVQSQAKAVSADASPAAHAEVVLELSAAAQSLLTR